MARIARIVLPGKPHLVSQGASRPIWKSPKRRDEYLEVLQAAAQTYRMKILAWAILPDEVMFVVVPPSAEAFSAFMRVTQTRFTRHLRRAGVEGTITPRRFASCPLDVPAAREGIKLVENLPVQRGLASSAWEYPHDSAAIRLKGGSDLLTEDKRITGSVGDWKAFLGEPLPEDRRAYLGLRLRTGKPAGAMPFIKKVEEMVGKNLSRGRGRPPKNPKA